MPVMQQFASRIGDAPRWGNLDELGCSPAFEASWLQARHAQRKRPRRVRLVPLRGLLGFICSCIKC